MRSAAHTHASWKPGERNFIIISLGGSAPLCNAPLFIAIAKTRRVIDQMARVWKLFWADTLVHYGIKIDNFTHHMACISSHLYYCLSMFVDNNNYYLTNSSTMMLMFSVNSFNIVIINRFVELIVLHYGVYNFVVILMLMEKMYGGYFSFECF